MPATITRYHYTQVVLPTPEQPKPTVGDVEAFPILVSSLETSSTLTAGVAGSIRATTYMQDPKDQWFATLDFAPRPSA